MNVRILGGLLLLFSGVLLGFEKSFCYEDCIENLKLLSETIEFLIGQIQTESATLPEAICRVSFRQDGPIGEILQNISKKYEQNEGKELFFIWQEEMKELPLKLPTKIANTWVHLFDQTGFYDRKGQLLQLMNAEETIRQETEDMEKQKKDKCRLYRSMGFMVSLFFIILLW